MFDAAGLPYPAGTGRWKTSTTALGIDPGRGGRPATDPSFDAGNIDQWGFTWWNEYAYLTESARAL